ncbi:glycosyltransferase family 1 protein [Intestinibacter sp.]|uniref:glycosyltransferase family 1 protein n=1 Tax=Intestinibacter sp. TaxID=1965304 RepID=UPI00307D2180
MDSKRTMDILHVVGTLNMGGAETMIVNIMKNINSNQFKFDFVVSGDEEGYYEKEVKKMGANVHHITKRSISFFKYYLDLYKIIKEYGYKIIHFHTQNSLLTSLAIAFVRLAGAKTIIVHSHNTNDWRGKKLIYLHKIFRPILGILTNVKLSCGKEAADWLYGTDKNVIIIPLPVDCEKFKYSVERKEALIQHYNFENKTIYAHAGRFIDVKNHDFLIDIFREINKVDENSILLLMGTGELMDAIKSKVTNYGLEKKVLFLGNVNDVFNKLIMADVFLLPSKYEGFPTVVLEAQAAGVPCIISDSITSKIAITDLVNRLPLSGTAKEWADVTLRTSKNDNKAREIYNSIISEKYDINVTVDKISEIYRRCL